MSPSFLLRFEILTAAIHSFNKRDTIPQDWLRGDCKHHKQHNAFHGHMLNAENISQPDAANQETRNAPNPDNPAQQIHEPGFAVPGQAAASAPA